MSQALVQIIEMLTFRQQLGMYSVFTVYGSKQCLFEVMTWVVVNISTQFANLEKVILHFNLLQLGIVDVYYTLVC